MTRACEDNFDHQIPHLVGSAPFRDKGGGLESGNRDTIVGLLFIFPWHWILAALAGRKYPAKFCP